MRLYETADGLPPMEAPQVPGPLSGLRVCFQVADEAGCGGYRCILPAGQLRALGAKVKWTHRVQRSDYGEYDVFIYQRPYDPMLATEMQEVSRMGKVCIVESDDNLHRVDPNSPVFRFYKPDKTQTPYTQAMLSADGMVVSTPELCEYYYQYNKNIFVAPNSIDLNLGVRDWSGTNNETGKKDSEVVIGWRGGVTHQEDLMELDGKISKVMDTHKNVRLALYSSMELSAWAVERWGLTLDRVTIIPPRNFCNYPKGLGGIDILLVPLKDSDFNDAKSELALAEAGALGIPCVASASAAYLRFSQGNKYALIAGKNGGWTEHLNALITDESYRKSLGAAAKERVVNSYDLEKNVWAWVRGIEAIIERKYSGDKGRGQVIKKAGPNDPCRHCLRDGVENPPKTKRCPLHRPGVKL